jgi:hypothetical protein
VQRRIVSLKYEGVSVEANQFVFKTLIIDLMMSLETTKKPEDIRQIQMSLL